MVHFVVLLARHLKRRHEDTYKAYEQERASLSSESDHGQTSLSSFLVSTVGNAYVSAHPRQKSLTNSLVSNLIVNCGLPVSIVDSPHFRAFVGELDPKFAVPCRQTVSNSILPDLLKASREKLQRYLNTCTDVSLTADIWTDRRSHAFLGVTVHSSRAGAAVSHLLAFHAFHGSHMGQRIADAMDSIIADNNLQSKVRFVVTDNASNMVKAMSVLFDTDDTSLSDESALNADPSLWEDMDAGDVEMVFSNLPVRMSCFAHSIQLVVRDGLASTGVIRTTLAKCSKLSNIVHQSSLFSRVHSRRKWVLEGQFLRQMTLAGTARTGSCRQSLISIVTS